MPWRETAREEYRRESDRYASDMTDGEWALIEPFMPPARRHGRPRTTDLREVVNAVLYSAQVLQTAHNCTTGKNVDDVCTDRKRRLALFIEVDLFLSTVASSI